MKAVTVAIDGPAGSGKSTVAKGVARKLDFLYVDTGAMYRAAALKAVRSGIEPGDDRALKEMLARTDIKLAPDGDGIRVTLDGKDVSDEIRTEKAGMDASTFSKSPAVRERLVEMQRDMGKAGGVVMEGRDIGTVVFPQAECKFYLDAGPEERARRRAKELELRGIKNDEAQILEQVKNRDRQDRSRSLAPLKPAPDAEIIDTSDITAEQVIEKILAAVSRKLKAKRE